MVIRRMFRREQYTDPAMLAKQAEAATTIHSVTIPKYRIRGNTVEYVIECSRINSTWQVYRRYQQFKTLDQQLKALCILGTTNHCEFGVIPVLSGSHWTEVTNQSPELVERRRRYLEIYLQQLLVPKNLFYAAKTPLYGFLHDGEAPIQHKSRSNRPLPGFGILPSSHLKTITNTTLATQRQEKKYKDVDAQNIKSSESLSTDDIRDISISSTDSDDYTTDLAISTSRQIVAVRQREERENIVSSAIPDYSASSKERTAKTTSSGNDKDKLSSSDSGIYNNNNNNNLLNDVVSKEGIISTQSDGILERCIQCGYKEEVDYDLEDWRTTGRCPKCRKYVLFELVFPIGHPMAPQNQSNIVKSELSYSSGDGKGEVTTITSNSTPLSAKEENKERTSDELGNNNCNINISGESNSNIQLERKKESIGICTVTVDRDDNISMVSEENCYSDEDEEDDSGVNAAICCCNCGRMFDIRNRARHCGLCNLRHCTSCLRKIESCNEIFDEHFVKTNNKNNDDKGDIGNNNSTNASNHIELISSRSTTPPAVKHTRTNINICDRCHINIERHQQHADPNINTNTSNAQVDNIDNCNVNSISDAENNVGVTLLSPSSPAVEANNQQTITSPGDKNLIQNTTPSLSQTPSKNGSNNNDNNIKDKGNMDRDTKTVVLSDFKLVTTLGRGTFGKVIKVILITTGKIYAMKVLTKSVIHKRRMISYIKEECNIMSLIKWHPFVCTCHFTFQTDHHLFLVLDYLPGGELYSHIYPKKNLDDEDAVFYIAEVILAVEHIHKHDIAHRDLKPENIVLDADGHLKITDFGLARMNFSKERRRSFVGSAEYLAPETIQGDVQTKALDWWSVGVMLYELLSGVAPFHAGTNNDVYQAILNKKPDFYTSGKNKSNFSPAAQDLIIKLLEKDVRRRLCDPSKIKSHRFFSKINWDSIYNREVKPPFVPNLEDNDTKYFHRNFTSEWATIQDPQGIGRQTIEILTRRFSNFRFDPQNEVYKSVPSKNTNNAIGKSSCSDIKHECELISCDGREGASNAYSSGYMVSNNTTMGVVDVSQGASHLQTIIPTLVNPDVFIGTWRLAKVEIISTDGKVCYPWGSGVAGILQYTTNALFSLQMCPLNRPKFKHTTIDKITKDELSEAYINYVAAFGTYTVTPGKSYIIHTMVAGLYPNATQCIEKRYFDVINKKKMRLLTSKMTLDGMAARTVVSWEKVGI